MAASDGNAARRDPELVLIFNHTATALEILFDAAADGSPAARTILESFAEKLGEAAARYGRLPIGD